MKTRRVLVAAALSLALGGACAQTPPAQQDPIAAQMARLRSLPDAEWVGAVGKLAREIQQLPASPRKTSLIGSLGNLVTEGDAGRETLQVVASTMAEALRGAPNSPLAAALAQLVRYEHLDIELDLPGYRAATAKLEAEDRRRESADFTLSDLSGKSWSLRDLRGKVVLVNFWATWCPPCRKEMPDMEALYRRFGPRGLMVLAISDEDTAKVQPFIAAQKYTYPVLLDAGRKVNELFGVQGIPKTFVYNREGKLAAQAIDRRTERQFLEMLKLAGLE
ncbi:MAG: TlpA family protein disulfide reductase [Acidobacteriia bacterium]|nr:TlpA family protein disulfide reductase [Terriglobia bacterium]